MNIHNIRWIVAYWECLRAKRPVSLVKEHRELKEYLI